MTTGKSYPLAFNHRLEIERLGWVNFRRSADRSGHFLQFSWCMGLRKFIINLSTQPRCSEPYVGLNGGCLVLLLLIEQLSQSIVFFFHGELSLSQPLIGCRQIPVRLDVILHQCFHDNSGIVQSADAAPSRNSLLSVCWKNDYNKIKTTVTKQAKQYLIHKKQFFLAPEFCQTWL